MTVIGSNEYGTISINKSSISKIAGIAAIDCYGIVGMAAKSISDGFFKLLKVERLERGVEINEVNGKLNIELHIIVLYGTSIPAIGKTLVDSVKYKIEKYTNLPVENIVVFVEDLKVDAL